MGGIKESDMDHVAQALRAIKVNARKHQHDEYRPEFLMLAQEVLELSLALRDEHERPAWLELVQIGGTIINWLADIMTDQGDIEVVEYIRENERCD